jgi:hypothetical protein
MQRATKRFGRKRTPRTSKLTTRYSPCSWRIRNKINPMSRGSQLKWCKGMQIQRFNTSFMDPDHKGPKEEVVGNEILHIKGRGRLDCERLSCIVEGGSNTK